MLGYLVVVWVWFLFLLIRFHDICKKETPMPKSLDKVYSNYFRKQVEDAGGVWVGIQECEGLAYDLVLFNSRKTGSTLAVKTTVGGLTDAVRQRIKDHEAEWLRITGYNR